MATGETPDNDMTDHAFMMKYANQPSAPAADTPWTCEWVDDEDGPWQTACGHAFEFTTDGPTENGFKHCPYCGRQLAPKET